MKKGRFFDISKLNEMGEFYFHKLHTPYVEDGKERDVADEIAVGEDVRQGRTRIIYVTRPLKYKGFEIYRDKEGYSPLFVLRDSLGKVLYGAFLPLQRIQQNDGTYSYSPAAPGNIDFPHQYPRIAPVFKLQPTFYPDKVKKRTGEALFQVSPIAHQNNAEGREEVKKLFKGRAALGERVKAGDYLLSMDEVRYWTSMNVNYRPGLPWIFGSFWITFGGLILNLVLKTKTR